MTTPSAFAATLLLVSAYQYFKRQRRLHPQTAQRPPQGTKELHGQCHCGAIVFSCTAPRHLVVWICDCSICDMLKNWHFIVPEGDFNLLRGKEALSLYEFNTKTAKHFFCKHCGVSPFYRPRSNPDGYAVTLACVVPASQVESFEYRSFDGQNWEAFHVCSGIQAFSQPTSTKSAPLTPLASPSPVYYPTSPAPSYYSPTPPRTPPASVSSPTSPSALASSPPSSSAYPSTP